VWALYPHKHGFGLARHFREFELKNRSTGKRLGVALQMTQDFDITVRVQSSEGNSLKAGDAAEEIAREFFALPAARLEPEPSDRSFGFPILVLARPTGVSRCHRFEPDLKA